MQTELSYGEIAFSYDASAIDRTAGRKGIVGQDRALRALRSALHTNRPGYNIFICGDFGTGRLSAVREAVEEVISDVTFIKDVIYVHNPQDVSSPVALILPPGQGRQLACELEKLDEKDYRETLTSLIADFSEQRVRNHLALLAASRWDARMAKPTLVLDNCGVERRPFIIEAHPSYTNLFGRVEDGRIIPGSYQKASGGFLLLFADELLAEKGLWDELKRHMDATGMAVKGGHVQDALGRDSRLRPEAIGLQTKIILLAGDELYDQLSEKDADFLRLFKSSPQFDYRMEATKENIAGCTGYLIDEAANTGHEISDGALLLLLRHSSWFAESREHLSSQLALLGDIVSEAASLSQGTIAEADIQAVIDEREYHVGLSEDRINEEIASGDLLVAVDGMKVGIVNGLAVMDRGLSSFGTPAVISATVAPGSEGIVNIEHEAGLSGGIHDKGLLILEGFLRHRYAKTFPLSLYAGICFEQSYAEVDGDSASLGELYALLSAIAEIPIRQDIAVTGSVSQMGTLQPVGGINEKIQGFFNACSVSGLTGTQGVMIPRQNISSLILPRRIEKAIDEGLFHLYAITEADDGIELLTGMKSGRRDRKGQFPLSSFNRRVEDGLRNLCRYSQEKG